MKKNTPLSISSCRFVALNGPWRILDDQQGILSLSGKHLALYLFLLVNGSQGRDHLYQLFFGGTTRANLRVFLRELRQLTLIYGEINEVAAQPMTCDLLELQRALKEGNLEYVRALCLEPMSLAFLYDLSGLSSEALVWFEEYFTHLHRQVFIARMQLAESAFEQQNHDLLRLYVQEALSYAQMLQLDVDTAPEARFQLIQRLRQFAWLVNATEVEPLDRLLDEYGFDQAAIQPLALASSESSLVLRRKPRLDLAGGVWQALDHETVEVACDFLLQNARIEILTHGLGKSLDVIRLSQTFIRQIDCPVIRGRLFNIQGLAFKKLGWLNQAQDCFQEAMGLWKDRMTYLPNILTNLGIIRGLLDDTSGALEYLRAGLALRVEQRNIASQANGHGLIANILTQQGCDQAALQALDRADRLYQEREDQSPYSQHFSAFRSLNRAVLQIHQGNYDLAAIHVAKAEEIFYRNDELEGQMEVALVMYHLAVRCCDIEKAHAAHKQLKRYQEVFGLSSEAARKTYRLEDLGDPVRVGKRAKEPMYPKDHDLFHQRAPRPHRGRV